VSAPSAGGGEIGLCLFVFVCLFVCVGHLAASQSPEVFANSACLQNLFVVSTLSKRTRSTGRNASGGAVTVAGVNKLLGVVCMTPKTGFTPYLYIYITTYTLGYSIGIDVSSRAR